MKYINPLDVAPKCRGGLGYGKAKAKRIGLAKAIWNL